MPRFYFIGDEDLLEILGQVGAMFWVRQSVSSFARVSNVPFQRSRSFIGTGMLCRSLSNFPVTIFGFFECRFRALLLRLTCNSLLVVVNASTN